MKLWLIEQTVNGGCDTYDSAVVAAETEDAARLIHPSGAPWDGVESPWGSWTNSENVKAALIGEAAEGTAAGVIVASFNAG